MIFKKNVRNLVLLLVMMFTFGFSLNVHADEPVDNNDYSNEVVPGYEKTSRWSYTDSVSAALTIDTSGNTTATCSVTGYQSTTTKIIVYAYLQKLDGSSGFSIPYGL